MLTVTARRTIFSRARSSWSPSSKLGSVEASHSPHAFIARFQSGLSRPSSDSATYHKQSSNRACTIDGILLRAHKRVGKFPSRTFSTLPPDRIHPAPFKSEKQVAADIIPEHNATVGITSKLDNAGDDTSSEAKATAEDVEEKVLPAKKHVHLDPEVEKELERTKRHYHLLGVVVKQLNTSFEAYPLASIISIVGMEMTAVFGTYQLLSMAGATFTPNFALAFALSRPFRRVRFPLELGAAALLAKAFPQLTEVKLAELFKAFRFGSPKEKPEAATSSFTEPSGIQKWMQSGVSVVSNQINKYGAAYFIGARAVGVASVFTFYAMIEYGVDTSSILAFAGLQDSKLGDVMGSWAAAVVLSSTFYPATVAAAGYLAPVVGRVLRNIKAP